jgi:hypothetical protein
VTFSRLKLRLLLVNDLLYFNERLRYTEMLWPHADQTLGVAGALTTELKPGEAGVLSSN